MVQPTNKIEREKWIKHEIVKDINNEKKNILAYSKIVGIVIKDNNCNNCWFGQAIDNSFWSIVHSLKIPWPMNELGFWSRTSASNQPLLIYNTVVVFSSKNYEPQL